MDRESVEDILNGIMKSVSMLELCGIDSFFIAIETNSTKSSTDLIHSAFSKSGRGFVQENDLISRFVNFSYDRLKVKMNQDPEQFIPTITNYSFTDHHINFKEINSNDSDCETIIDGTPVADSLPIFKFENGISEHSTALHEMKKTRNHKRSSGHKATDNAKRCRSLSNAKTETHDFGTKSSQSASLLQKHTRKRTKNQKYSCSWCKKLFRRHGHLSAHLRSHKQEKAYVCFECHESYSNESNLFRHLLVHNRNGKLNENLAPMSVQPDDGKSDVTTFKTDNTDCDIIKMEVENGCGALEEMNDVGRKQNNKNCMKENIPVWQISDQTFLCNDDLKIRKLRFLIKNVDGRRVNETVGDTSLNSKSKVTYDCKTCHKKFFHKGHYTVHLSIHTGEKPFVCDVCERRYTTISSLNRHQTVHTHSNFNLVDLNKNNEICQIDDDEQNKKHPENRTLPDQIKAEENLNSGFKFKIHSIGKYNCKKIKWRNPSDEKLCKCTVCDKECSSLASLKRHMLHHGDESVSCKICGKEFKDPSWMPRHMLIHTSEKNFQCSDCGKKFQRRSHFNTHKLNHRLHETGERPHLCTVCGKRFLLSSHLKSHMKVHVDDRPHKCEQCSKRFKWPYVLQCHMLTHTGEKPFKCSECDRCFTQRSHYNLHMKAHNGDKPFVCSACGKAFTSNSCLNTHMRKHNKMSGLIPKVKSQNDGCIGGNSLAEKPYLCSVCNKRFAYSGSLRPHMRIHTGEKPFICDLCGKEFSHKQSMKKHFAKHEYNQYDVATKAEVI